MRPMLLDALLCLAALALAVVLQPWRSLDGGGPPWPWLAWWAVLPLSWSADLLAGIPLVQPLSGAALLVLLAGWPLTVLALLPVAGVLWALGGMGAAEALHRLVWLGLAPATLALALGAGVRRWLPGHLFIYIMGRGFFVTWAAAAGAGALALGVSVNPLGTSLDDLRCWRAFSAPRARPS